MVANDLIGIKFSDERGCNHRNPPSKFAYAIALSAFNSAQMSFMHGIVLEGVGEWEQPGHVPLYIWTTNV